MKLPVLVSVIACGMVAILLLLSAGCHGTTVPADSEATQEAVNESTGAEVVLASTGKGGAQAWSENCMRCHNYRQPRERSDREWDIIVHHMRVRANLTAEEHRSILAFLKSAN